MHHGAPVIIEPDQSHKPHASMLSRSPAPCVHYPCAFHVDPGLLRMTAHSIGMASNPSMHAYINMLPSTCLQPSHPRMLPSPPLPSAAAMALQSFLCACQSATWHSREQYAACLHLAHFLQASTDRQRVHILPRSGMLLPLPCGCCCCVLPLLRATAPCSLQTLLIISAESLCAVLSHTGSAQIGVAKSTTVGCAAVSQEAGECTMRVEGAPQMPQFRERELLIPCHGT